MSDEETPPAKSELAEDRTDLAEDRTVMAAERTFAGWLRTSFAAIGIGIAFRGLFGALEPSWLPRAIASVFIAVGVIVAIGAERRISKTFERLSAHNAARVHVPRLRWIVYAVIAGAIVLVIAFWWMS